MTRSLLGPILFLVCCDQLADASMNPIALAMVRATAAKRSKSFNGFKRARNDEATPRRNSNGDKPQRQFSIARETITIGTFENLSHSTLFPLPAGIE